jgi:proteasome lid subunit RPN8/RPN11
VRLTAALLQEIVDAARAALPNEAVGLLVGRDGPERYVAMRNASVSPYRYSIDEAEQLRVWTDLEATGQSIHAIVHSHVASAAVPSKTDIELAYFPESLYLICSLANPAQPEVRAWSIVDGSVSEVSIAVA